MLMFINVIFALFGVLLIYVSSSIVESGWLEIFSDNYSWIQSGTFYALVGFGVVLIVVSFLGCYGAWSGNRKLLKFYMYFLVLAIVVFVFVAAIGFLSSNTANDWKSRPFPAADDEVSGAQNFNRIYCYSQAVHYCNSANVAEAIDLFFPILSGFSSSFNELTGINQVCGLAGSNPVADIDQIKEACDACAETVRFKNYGAVYDWSLDECPLTDNSFTIVQYCLDLVTTGDLPEQEDTPYDHCRVPVLDFWAQWSLNIGLSASIFTVMCTALCIFVCVSKDRSSSDPQEDGEYYGTHSNRRA